MHMEKTNYSRVGETLFHTRLENGFIMCKM